MEKVKTKLPKKHGVVRPKKQQVTVENHPLMIQLKNYLKHIYKPGCL